MRCSKRNLFHSIRNGSGNALSLEASGIDGDAGLLCTSVPEQDGGPGADRLTAVVMLEELSDLGLTGMALNFAMHSEIVTPYLLKYCSEQQKARWLPAMISGERIGALAMTEPAAGSDLQRMRTVAQREGNDFRLNGQKTFISNGQHTNLTIVAAKTDPAEGAKASRCSWWKANAPDTAKVATSKKSVCIRPTRLNYSSMMFGCPRKI